jgi:hypothetical protein
MNLAAPFESIDEYLEVCVSNKVLFPEHLVTTIRYAGVIWLSFLSRYLYLISLWLGEVKRSITIKIHV